MPVEDARTKTFIKALNKAEQSKDVNDLVKLFAADVQIGSIALRKPREGTDGARTFWTDYLSAFQKVQSEFVHTHVAGDLAVLEWKSEGVLPEGAAINYQGVSVIEFQGEKISRFRTYYDSAAFLPDGAKLLGRDVQV